MMPRHRQLFSRWLCAKSSEFERGLDTPEILSLFEMSHQQHVDVGCAEVQWAGFPTLGEDLWHQSA
jgi:hypothetical protein